jgi:hypothetical protein
MKEIDIWQMLLWLQKNKTLVKDNTAQKNMFVIHEHQMKLKLKKDEK